MEKLAALHADTSASNAAITKELGELKKMVTTLGASVAKLQATVDKMALTPATKRSAPAKKTAPKEIVFTQTFKGIDDYIEFMTTNHADKLQELLGEESAKKLADYKTSEKYTKIVGATKKNDAEVQYIIKVLLNNNDELKKKVEANISANNKQADEQKQAQAAALAALAAEKEKAKAEAGKVEAGKAEADKVAEDLDGQQVGAASQSSNTTDTEDL